MDQLGDLVRFAAETGAVRMRGNHALIFAEFEALPEESMLFRPERYNRVIAEASAEARRLFIERFRDRTYLDRLMPNWCSQA